MKTPIIVKDNYVVYLENYQNNLFVHCDCKKWGKKIKQELILDFNKMCSVCSQPIYAIHDIDDDKHRKFLNVFDFKFLKNFVGVDGKLRQIFVRR